jgi:hypothetical protein
MYEVKIEKRINKDNLLVLANELKLNKQPKESLEDKIARAVSLAITPILTRLDKIEERLSKVIKLNNLKE